MTMTKTVTASGRNGRRAVLRWSILLCGVAVAPASLAADIDTTGYSPDCGTAIMQVDDRLHIDWSLDNGQHARMVLNLDDSRPLIETLSIAGESGERDVMRHLDPAFFLTVGSRNVPPGKPPEQKWEVFFDNPARRPHETYAARLERSQVRVSSHGSRATVSLGRLSAGPFAGTLQLNFQEDCPLVHVEAVLRTSEDGRAIVYDGGLVSATAPWQRLVWKDTEGRMQQRRVEAASAGQERQELAVRHRVLVAETAGGSVACFPPPHQFQFPRDWTDNLRFVWYGRGHAGLEKRPGFGIRQPTTGGGNFVPWFNAPPKKDHRLGMFLLVSSGPADAALEDVLRLTHGDRFPRLPGHLTMTSHYHMAVAVTAMEQQKRGRAASIPEFVDMFKQMGVNMVHLADFHGDGNQKDPGPLRLPELQALFQQCRRLSDDQLLLIPGEEVNTFLGLEIQGKHPGHWMSLFPRPVYWIMSREGNQPFVEEHPEFGQVYRVGGRADMIRLLKVEQGLAWAAHPRIKASSWTPDIFRHEDFFVADFWLGGAWKSMPSDLSEDRLGRRVLDLLDDMANWGTKKYVPGEVDVFKLDHTHELYSHMNINYVRLEQLPRFDQGWRPLLDALRNGQFFVSTGEVLIHDFRVDGKQSGETVALTGRPAPRRLDAELSWTFPLNWAEIVTGDGQQVFRRRIDLSRTKPHGQQKLAVDVDLTGRHWVRLEVWDIAQNGAFTQPIWLAR